MQYYTIYSRFPLFVLTACLRNNRRKTHRNTTVQSNSRCTVSSPKNWLTDRFKCSDVFFMHENFKLVNCLLPRSRQTKNWHQQTRLLSWVNESDDYNSPSSTDHRTRRRKPDGRQSERSAEHNSLSIDHTPSNLKFGNDLTRRQASISRPTSQTPDQSPMLWFRSVKTD